MRDSCKTVSLCDIVARIEIGSAGRAFKNCVARKHTVIRKVNHASCGMSGGMHNAEFNLIKAYDVAVGNKHIGSKGACRTTRADMPFFIMSSSIHFVL